MLTEQNRNPMIQSHHKKIAIIGCAGSGKTTLALQLNKKLQLPLYHLDKYYWHSNWQRTPLEEFIQIHYDLCEQDQWIIEGSYHSTLFPRIFHADVIIFLDLPRSVCFRRLFKRMIFNYGKVSPGNTDQCTEHFNLDYLKFLKWVWNFKKRSRRMILYTLDEFKSKKQIHILKSEKEVQQFIHNNLS